MVACEHLAHVLVEVGEGLRLAIPRDAELLAEHLLLLVVALLLADRQRAHVARVHEKRRVDERRVDPHEQLGVPRVVRRACRVAATGLLRHALHPAVDLLDAVGRLLRGLCAAEDDLRGQVERPVEPAPRVLAVVRVLGDPGGDQRMGDLQDESAAAPEKQHALPVDTPRDGAGSEQTLVAHSGAILDLTAVTRSRVH